MMIDKKEIIEAIASTIEPYDFIQAFLEDMCRDNPDWFVETLLKPVAKTIKEKVESNDEFVKPIFEEYIKDAVEDFRVGDYVDDYIEKHIKKKIEESIDVKLELLTKGQTK